MEHLAIWGAIIGTVGLVMAFARTGPDEARNKLAEWAEVLRLQRLAAFLSRHSLSERVLRYGKWIMVTLLFVGGMLFHSWLVPPSANPAIYDERDQLKALAQSNQQDAAKWRFAFNLRYGPRAANGNLLTCKFTLVLSPGDRAWNLWGALQPMLELAHWESTAASGQGRPETPFQNVAILVGDNTEAVSCGTALGKVMGDAFPQSQVSFRTKQVSPALVACKNECVELNVGN
jgi:hypothetical protein